MDSRRILTGKMTPKDWKKIREARDRIEALDYFPLYFDDVSGYDEDIIDQAGEMFDRHGKGVVYVDYLQLVDADGNNQREKIDRVTKQLKKLSKFVGIPVVALVQLNRAADDAGPGLRVS